LYRQDEEVAVGGHRMAGSTRFAIVALAPLVALAMVACAATQPPAPVGGESQLLRAAGVTRAEVRDAPTAAVARGMTAFGHELYRLGVKPAENGVLSPLSIAVAFGMARAGANGRTAAEIDAVLHFPAKDLHAAFNDITRQCVTTDGPPAPADTKATGADRPTEPPVVAIANGLFAQNGMQVKDAYLRLLAAQYGAGVRTVNFASDTAKRQIDEWVRQHTAGLIKELFEQIDPGTRLVLANALYLRAAWQFPFAELPTDNETFTRADGSTVSVPMMQQHHQLRYAAGNGWQAAEVPYAGGEFAMRILVPTGRTAPIDLLAPRTLAAVAAELRPARVSLSLPRWKSTSSFDLIGYLQQLGMVAPFSNADFSGISAEGLEIGQAVHRATITVDEWGTEAAAVTGLGFAVSAPGPSPLTVRADHPFAYTIVHKPTGVPLFIGHVADPTASG
jgi:serine protease inhibitor